MHIIAVSQGVKIGGRQARFSDFMPKEKKHIGNDKELAEAISMAGLIRSQAEQKRAEKKK
tara:strand:- start:1210 stop:1389 length:180 start_codon:yes stop_codon:yes gene_type:complete